MSATDTRHIRTFVPRRGRMSATQARALECLWDRYVLPADPAPINPDSVFGRTAPLVVEIGFGLGEATAAMAAADPSTDVLAIEVHTPGIGQLMHLVDDTRLTNVRILRADAIEALRERLDPASLAGIRVFFPDPWPKHRHHKRRLVRPEIVDLFADRLVDGGLLHIATDWHHYAVQARELLRAHPALVDLGGSNGFAARPPWRPVTRFERYATQNGQAVYDLLHARRPRVTTQAPA
jgi:tRNA (guanine-N7-)-methyltransferase